MLNNNGKDLMKIKEGILKGKIEKGLISSIVSVYPDKIKNILQSNEYTVDDLYDFLLNDDKYTLSKSELENKLAEKYDKALSICNQKYSINLIGDTLYVSKFIRLSKNYYANFMGIDLKVLEVQPKRKYDWNNTSTNINQTEINNFKLFAERRLKAVGNKIVNDLYNEKLIPAYKNKLNKPMAIQYSLELGKNVGKHSNMKDIKNILNISFKIDLKQKNDFNSNIKLIDKFLPKVTDNIEKYLQFELYK